MRFRKIPVALMLVLGCVALCFGQGVKAKPDLNGRWEFDRTRSNVGQSSSSTAPPEQIEINYADPELRIHRKFVVNGLPQEREQIYYTDGRGETNQTSVWVTANPGSNLDRPAETKSKTTWSGNK